MLFRLHFLSSFAATLWVSDRSTPIFPPYTCRLPQPSNQAAAKVEFLPVSIPLHGGMRPVDRPIKRRLPGHRATISALFLSGI